VIEAIATAARVVAAENVVVEAVLQPKA